MILHISRSLILGTNNKYKFSLKDTNFAMAHICKADLRIRLQNKQSFSIPKTMSKQSNMPTDFILVISLFFFPQKS